ncbi:MAG: hypothetical protein ACLQFI_03700 [Methylocella sp.]
MQIGRRDVLAGLAAITAAASLPAVTGALASSHACAAPVLYPAPPFSRFAGQRVWFESSPVWRGGQPPQNAWFWTKFSHWHIDPRPPFLIRRCGGDELTFRRVEDASDPFAIAALYVDPEVIIDIDQLRRILGVGPEDDIELDAESIEGIAYAARVVAMHGDLVAGCRGIRGAFFLCYTLTGTPDDHFYHPDISEAPPIV